MFSFLKKTPPPTPPSDAAGAGTAYTASQVAAIKADPTALANEQVLGTAHLLLEKANVPPRDRDAIAQKMVPILKEADPTRIGVLIRMAKHTCTRSWVAENYGNLAGRLAAARQASPNKPGEPSEEERLLDDFYTGMAITIGYGFDDVEKRYITRDAAGNVIGHYNNGRTPLCDATIKTGLRLNPPEYFGAARRRHRKKTVRKARKSARKTRRR